MNVNILYIHQIQCCWHIWRIIQFHQWLFVKCGGSSNHAPASDCLPPRVGSRNSRDIDRAGWIVKKKTEAEHRRLNTHMSDLVVQPGWNIHWLTPTGRRPGWTPWPWTTPGLNTHIAMVQSPALSNNKNNNNNKKHKNVNGKMGSAFTHSLYLYIHQIHVVGTFDEGLESQIRNRPYRAVRIP